MIYDIAQFGFSFLVLISVWLTYTHIMSVLPLEDRSTIALNIALLFLVAIEPYLFHLNVAFDLVASEGLLDTASILFTLDMAGLMTILALFLHQLSLEERKLLPHDIIGGYKRVRDELFISALLFGATVFPIFWAIRVWDIPLRFYVWLVPVVVSSCRRVSTTRSENGNIAIES